MAQHTRRLALIASPSKSHKLQFSFRFDSVKQLSSFSYFIFLFIYVCLLYSGLEKDGQVFIRRHYLSQHKSEHDSWMASYTLCVCFRLSWWTCGRSWQMSRQRRLWWRRRFTNNFCNSTPCSSNSKPKADRRSTLTPSRTGWWAQHQIPTNVAEPRLGFISRWVTENWLVGHLD